MEISASLPTALAAIALGLGLLALIGLTLRWITARGPLTRVASPVSLPVQAGAEDAAVVVAQPGGRVLFANQLARQFFELNGQEPNLWRMAQRAQPADTFLELFVTAGTASVRIGERRVEATSLQVPVDESGASRFVVVLRETGHTPELASVEERAAQVVSVMGDITRAISTSLDLSATLDAILAQLGRAFQYNIAEITLWDADQQVLRPARHAGDPAYAHELARSADYFYKPDEGFSGWLATHRQPLLVSNVEAHSPVRPKLERPDFPFRSYLGAPLLAGQQFVGTLELVSYRAEMYRPSDLPMLTAIAGQAAVAIQNAQRFAEQQQRIEELAGLSEITRAIVATGNPRELHQRLTDDIARLMGVQMVGLLLHDSGENALVGQAPFHGVPDMVVDLYRLPLTAGSAAERIWRENDYWLSNDLLSEPLLDETGLRQLAETAGVKTTLLAPIVLGDRRIGLVQASNKINGRPFTDADARLLTIFASQTAAILENARLVRVAQARAEQADGLREIAATVAAGTTLEGILRPVMQQIGAVLGCNVGVIALLDETRGELVPHPASVFGGLPEEAEAIRLSTDDPFFAYSVTRTRRPFLTNRALHDRRVASLYRAIVEHYQMNSVMDVPLVVGDKSLGELIVGARREHAFTRTDLQLLATIASQLASAIERARLYTTTDANLQRRVEQLTALTRVGRELNQTLDRERILRLVYDEVITATQAACGTIVLLGENPESGQLALRIGEEKLGYRLTPLEEEVARSERVRQVTNLQPLDPMTAHAEVRAALVVPITVQGAVVGLIHLHTANVEGFDETAVETAVALSAQAAIAVANTQRYDEQLKRGELLRRRADQLSQLFQISRAVHSDAPLAANLQAIAYGLQEAVGFNVVLISALSPQTGRLQRTASAGIPLATFEQIKQVEQPWESFAAILKDEFKISQSYFLPAEKAADLTAGLDTVLVTQSAPQPAAPNAWNPDDMLIVPLLGSGNEPVGVLTVDDPRDGKRPERSAIEIIEIFANQAALAIENARLYQAAERRAARLLALHRVIERTSYLPDRAQLWQVVAESLIKEMGLDVALIALPEAGRFVVRGQAGTVRPELDLSPLLTVTEGTLAASARREPLLVLNIKHGGWASDPLVVATEVTSFVNVPIVSQGVVAGVLFAGSRRAPAPFAEEDLELFIILTNQLGGSLESARLEADIRQRAAQLAALADASQTITATLRTEDVVQAVLVHLKSVVPYDSVTLWLREGEVLRVAAAQGFENDAERVGVTTSIEDSALFIEMARTRAAVLVPDVRHDARFPAAAYQPTRSWLGAPLTSQGRIIGALALDKTEAHHYTATSAQVLAAFANQAAVAVENARLYADSEARTRELSQRTERLTFLNRIAVTLSASLDLDTILRHAAEEVTRLFGVDHSGIVLFDESAQTGTVEAEYPDRGAAGLRLSLANDPLEQALLVTRAPVVVEEIAGDERLTPALRENFARLGIQSILIAPFIAQGRAIGSYSLDAMAAPRHFTADEIELAQTIAAQVAVAVTNARFAHELEARVAARTREVELERERVQTLLQITSELSASLDLDRVLARALQLVTEAVHATQGSIFLMDLQSDQLIYRAALGRPDPLPPGGILSPLKRNEGLVGWVIKNRKAVVLGNLDEDPRWKPLPHHEGRYKSALAVPLMANEDALGAMILLHAEYNAFDEDQMRLVEAAASQVGAAINNAELYRLIRDQAERLGGMLRGQQVEATKSRAILEGIADGVLVADADGKVILFNVACERILHLSREAVLSRPMTDLVGIYGSAGRAWVEAMNAWSLDPETYQPGEFFSERIELDDQRVISVHLAPVTTADEFLGSVSVIRDITRDVEVERLKSEFVTNVSHELRTPMTSIKGYADILLMGAAGSLSQDQVRFIEVIKSNADRLSILVNDLLDISRIESGQVELVLRPVNIGEVIGDVMATLRGRVDHEGKPMTLRAEVPADLPPVQADRQRLTQVLMNLADNAFNYSPPSGSITLTTRLAEGGHEMLVEVSDTGVGIALDDQPRLFERFYRGGDALVLGTAGTGLGLPIAKQLIEKHGGRLWLARSEAGHGSTFALTLPLTEGE